MRSISNLSTALIIAAAIVLIGNLWNCGLSTLAAATMGFVATSIPNVPTVFLFCLSGVLFALGVVLAVVSIALEGKREK